MVVSGGPAFEAQRTSFCGQPAGRQLSNTKARYCYPPSEGPDLLRTKTEIDASLEPRTMLCWRVDVRILPISLSVSFCGHAIFPASQVGQYSARCIRHHFSQARVHAGLPGRQELRCPHHVPVCLRIRTAGSAWRGPQRVRRLAKVFCVPRRALGRAHDPGRREFPLRRTHLRRARPFPAVLRAGIRSTSARGDWAREGALRNWPPWINWTWAARP